MPAREKHSEPAGGRLRIQRKLLDLDSLTTQGPFCLEPLVVADISVASYAHTRAYWVLQRRLIRHVSRCLHMITNEWAIWDEDVYKLGSTFLLGVPYADQGKVDVVREDPPHALHRPCPPQHRPDKPLPKDLHHAIGRWSPDVPASSRACDDLHDPFLTVGLPFAGRIAELETREAIRILLADTQSSECVGQSAGVLKRHGGFGGGACAASLMRMTRPDGELDEGSGGDTVEPVGTPQELGTCGRASGSRPRR
jgi:hypothetical protein